MHDLMLLTDGSVDSRSQTGYGAYLTVADPELPAEEVQAHVKVRRFEQISSTKLELQTLLWALSDLQGYGGKLLVYTDSQNIVGLPGRRERLQRKDYHSGNDKLLANHLLYREFFRLTDQLDCEFIKVQGHRLSKQKDAIDRLFTLVDRASRKALRTAMNHL